MNQKQLLHRIILFSSIIFAAFSLIVSMIVMLSPYGNHPDRTEKLIQVSIPINASSKQVFDYLGNSDNARDWSVFVDHISPVNNSYIADGAEGSIRRCFVNANEKGKSWDELVLEVKPHTKRLLSCYAYEGFNLTAGELYTEQIYSNPQPNKCVLSLTLFLPPGENNWITHLKMYYAGYEIAKIFKLNLENIKILNEKSTTPPHS